MLPDAALYLCFVGFLAMHLMQAFIIKLASRLEGFCCDVANCDQQNSLYLEGCGRKVAYETK